MDIIFDESFHHISQEGFLQHDGIQIFQDATKHFEGHEAKDVIFHQQNLHRFRPTLRMYFRSDAVNLDDFMRRVEQVTGKPQSDIEKLAIFLNHFHADSRPGVAVRIQTMVLMNATYEVMYKSVCEMYPIEETPHHRAMLVPKSTELCRRRGLGTCPHSDADYRHILKGKAGAFALKLTGKTPGARTPPSPQPTGSKPYPNHIAERHRAAIRPYTGTISPTNPTGISRSQVKKVLALQRAEREDPDPWSTGSIAHASGSTEIGYHHPRVLMLDSSSSSFTAVYDATPPHSETSDSSSSDDVDYTPVKFTPPRAKSCAFILTPSFDVARLMQTYLESVRPTDNGDRRDWVQFLSRHVTTQEKSPPTPILAILGWLTRGPSRQLSCARQRVPCTPSCRVPACGCPVQRKAYYAPVSRILE
jgi:hypothetical protein